MLTRASEPLSGAVIPSSLPSASEADNQPRFDPADAGGHVESLFLKGNSPDGRRALWLKYTLLSPRAHPERAVAELWAVAFDRALAPRAAKQTFPLSAARIASSPFSLTLPTAELRHGYARGELSGPGARFRWELRYPCAAEAFRPFPSPRMYTGRFPRTKTLTPAPDSRLTGFFEVNGERWDVHDYAAAQGHNWGRGHAHAYAWAHANALDVVANEGAPVHDAWLELLTGRVRLGPWLTPWLSCAAICVDGRLHRFDGPASMLSRAVRIDHRTYQFRFRQAGAELSGDITADARLIAGLRYEDPDGQTLACLNSKLASGRFTLRTRGATYRFASERVALELGTRARDHGVTILV